MDSQLPELTAKQKKKKRLNRERKKEKIRIINKEIIFLKI